MSKTKEVLKKFRSTNVIYADYSMTVTPLNATGESSQMDVVASGGGKMFLTRGTKKQTRCVHLAVDSKADDPVGLLYKQLGDVIGQARKDGQELPEYQPAANPRARCWKRPTTTPAT